MHTQEILVSIDSQIARLKQARAALTDSPTNQSFRKHRRPMSASARHRISVAQKARWARVKRKQAKH
jgi:hypothetical protein